ncbi:hypothetical protein INT45_012246 [Circinella minor]|uniref:Uncharacterized protein n=1 Tax=Circinella minor TaxID=1195481 RepID=A0A8H7S3E0_9FUNG|nr:hypothetical protein INT45_012246 [Circinella minor]
MKDIKFLFNRYYSVSAHLTKSLWIIFLRGYDYLDIDTCTARGIYVSNTPSAVDAATADTGCLLILSAFRNASQAERNLRKGRWSNGVSLGHDPEGKTLGILGLGGIGEAVDKRIHGFDMRIQYYNRTCQALESKPSSISSPHITANNVFMAPYTIEEQYHATYVDFQTLLKTSDCIYVSVPLTKATFHLLDSPQFAMMKDGVIIVNTSRGKVINESALVNALEYGKVAAVGLDVFEQEPEVIHPGLLSHPHSTLLPHIGTSTKESMRKMELVVLKNAEVALTLNTLITPIHEHKQFF